MYESGEQGISPGWNYTFRSLQHIGAFRARRQTSTQNEERWEEVGRGGEKPSKGLRKACCKRSLQQVTKASRKS